MDAVEFALTGRPVIAAIKAAAVDARPEGWELDGRFRLTLRVYRAGPFDPRVAPVVVAALDGVLLARGANVIVWASAHEPDDKGERVEVQLERIDRTSQGAAREDLTLPGLEGREAEHARDPGGDWPTDPNGQGAPSRQAARVSAGRSAQRAGTAMISLGGRSMTIAEAITKRKK
jgi:hypothetical protein